MRETTRTYPHRGKETRAGPLVTCQFEYDYRYFGSYAKKRASIDALYIRFMSWAGVLDGRGKNALDIGAAFGYTVELLESLGYRALGLDISRYASSRSEAVICGDAEAPPLKQESFDLITCFETIEHLPHPDRAIACFYGLLKDHGTLLVTTPTPLGEKVHRRFLKHYPYYSTDDDLRPTDAVRDAHHPSIRACQD
jgi:2-polyprenyl-3-methyl-5-hydroxy-6-metoxy-1,4-benzoquinol methylase